MKNNCMDFFNEKLWLVKSSGLPLYRRIPLTAARVAILTIRRFIQNQCTIKASALTFYTLFSIVPVLALIFGIAKGLGLSQILDEKIRSLSAEYPVIAEKLITISDTMLQNARGGLVAGIGILLLLWSVIKLLSSIENNMNEIWGIPHGRSLVRKITDYIAIMIICPLLLLAAGSSVVFAAARMDQFVGDLPGGVYLSAVLRTSHGLTPLVFTWIVFTFIYMVIPNTKVRLKPALIAGLLTAAVYTLLETFYVFAQFTTSKLNAIYGSFAALPLFLTWLNLSWILILAGSQLTFAIQNVSEYEMQPVDSKPSQLQRYVYSIEIVAVLIRQFTLRKGAMTDDQISEVLELPIRMVRTLLFDLVRCGILTMTHSDGGRSGNHYIIAIPPEQITAGYLIRSLNDLGGSKYMNEQAIRCRQTYEKIQALLNEAPANLPIAQLSRDFLPEEPVQS